MGSYNYGIAPMKYSGYPAQSQTQGRRGCEQGQQGQQGRYDAGSGPRYPHHRRNDGSGFRSGGVGDMFRGNMFGARQQRTSSDFAAQAFAKFDTNGDGQITRDELIAGFDAIRGVAATTTDTTTTSVDSTDTSTSIDTTTPTTDTTVTSTDASTDDALTALLASTDTSTVEVPVAPTVDDSTAASVN